MTNKELGIIVTGDLSDAEAMFERLDDIINEFVDKIINIVFNVDAAELDNVSSELATIDDKTVELTINADDNASEVEQNVLELASQIDGTDVELAANINDDVGGVLEEIQAKVEELDGKEITLNMDLQGGQDTIQQIGEVEQASGDLGGELVSIAGIIAAMQIDKSVLGLNKALEKTVYYGNGSADSLEKLKQQARDLQSAHISIEEIANAQLLLTQATGDVNASMEIMPGIINYVKVSGADLTVSTKTAADIMQKYGLTTKETADAMNYMAAAKTKMKMSGDELAVIIDRLSGDFTQMGLSVKDATDLVYAFDQSGVRSQEIMMGMRTGFRYFIMGLDQSSPNFEKIKKALDELGISMVDSNGNMKTAGQLSMEASDKLGTMENSTKKTQIAVDLFGPSASKTFAILSHSPKEAASAYGNSVDEIVTKTKEINKENLTAQEQLTKFWNWVLSFIPASVAKVGVALAMSIGGWFAASGLIGKWIDFTFGTGSKWYTKITDFNKGILGRVWAFGQDMFSTIKGWMGWGDEAAKAGNSVNMRLAGEIKDTSILSRIKNFGGNVLGNIKSWMGWGDEAAKATINLSRTVEGGFEMKPSILQKITEFGSKIASALKLPSVDLGIAKLFDDASLGGFLKGAGKVAGGLAVVTIGLDALWSASEYYSGGIVSGLLKITGIESLLSFVGLGESVKNFEAWGDGITGTVEQLVDNVFGSGFGDMVGKFASDMQNTFRSSIDFSSAGAFFSSWADLISLPFRDIYNEGPVQWLERIFGRIYELLTPVGGMISQRLAGATEWISAPFRDAYNYLVSLPGQIQNTIMSMFNVDWNAVGYNIGAGVGNIIATLLQYTFYFLQSLIALPGNVYNAIVGLGQSIYIGLIAIPGQIMAGLNMISAQFWGFINYLTTIPGQAYNAIFGVGTSVVAAAATVPTTVKGGLNMISAQFWGFINYLTTIPGQAYNSVVGLGQYIYNGLASIPGQVYNGLLNIWKQFTSFVGWLASLPGQFYNAIVNAFNGFVKGLRDQFPQITYWLDKIRGLFPHSPPKWGPLVDIMDWGGNMADAIGSGFKQSFPDMVSSFSNQLSNLKDIASGLNVDIPLTSNLSSFALPNASINALLQPNTIPAANVTQEVAVKVEIGSLGSISNAEAAEKGQIIGNAAGEQISKILNEQMTDNGISTENSVR